MCVSNNCNNGDLEVMDKLDRREEVKMLERGSLGIS